MEVEKQREELEAELLQRRADIQAVLELPAGRRVLERLVFEFGGLQEQCHAADSHQRSFHDGQRAVGITLDRELYRSAQDGWALMHTQRVERLRLVDIDKKPNKTDQGET